jgi:hypothetical protein
MIGKCVFTKRVKILFFEVTLRSLTFLHEIEADLFKITEYDDRR